MIYLDNHATTACDPRVVEAMLPWLTESFGNPHSDSHEFGRTAAAGVRSAVELIAKSVGVQADHLVITSGATESILLGIRGVCTYPRQNRRTIVTTATEHAAVSDVATELSRDGFDIKTVGVDDRGVPDLDDLRDSMSDDVALVSVMWANNEVGTISPMKEIAEIAHQHGALLHSDATQAMGRFDVDACATDVDLISGSAHKFYGPKGVGFLTVGNGNRRVRVRPTLVGGGQQRGRRGGTMNPAAVIAMAEALKLSESDSAERSRIRNLRDRLWTGLSSRIPSLGLNGLPLDNAQRLAGNLNVMLDAVEGESWMAAAPNVAFSSGSACSSVDPAPSHVLLAMGLTESQARRSVRFGVGRFNNESQIDDAVTLLVAAHDRLTGKPA